MAVLDAIALERVLIDALAPGDAATLTDTPEWVQLTSPGEPEPNCNGVYLAQLDSADVDRRIAEVRTHYAERGLGFRWIVGPSTRPADLSARLERAGIPRTVTSLGLHREVPDSPPTSSFDGLELRPANVADLEVYGQVAARGWGRDGESGHFAQRVATALARSKGRLRSWIAFEQGRPIATSTLCILGRLGYLQGAAVVPESRGRGVYRALLDHRLAVLRELGIDDAVVWANAATSAGSCRRAGFVEICAAEFHELRVAG